MLTKSLLKRFKSVNKRGFTVIEVTLALALFALLSVAIVQSYDRGMKLLYQSVNLTGAATDSAAMLYTGDGENVTSQIEYEVGWLNVNSDGSGNGQMYAVEALSNDGHKVVYYYYRSYHPFACGAAYGKCAACNYTTVKPTAEISYAFYTAMNEPISSPAPGTLYGLKMSVTDGVNVSVDEALDCAANPTYSERVEVGKILIFSITSIKFFDYYNVYVNGVGVSMQTLEWRAEVGNDGVQIRFVEKTAPIEIEEEAFNLNVEFWQNATYRNNVRSGGTAITPEAIIENGSIRIDELSGMTISLAGRFIKSIRDIYSGQLSGNRTAVPAGVTLTFTCEDKYVFERYDLYVNGRLQQSARLSWTVNVPATKDGLNNGSKRFDVSFVRKNTPTSTILFSTDSETDFPSTYGLIIKEVTAAGIIKQEIGLKKGVDTVTMEVGNYLVMNLSNLSFYDDYSLTIGSEDISDIAEWRTIVTVGSIRINVSQLRHITWQFLNSSGNPTEIPPIEQGSYDPISSAKVYCMGIGTSLRDADGLDVTLGRGVTLSFIDNVVFYLYDVTVRIDGVDTRLYNVRSYSTIMEKNVQVTFKERPRDSTINIEYLDKTGAVTECPAIIGNTDPLFGLKLEIMSDSTAVETYSVRSNNLIELRSDYTIRVSVLSLAFFNSYDVLLDGSAIPRSTKEFTYNTAFSTLTVKEVSDPEAVVNVKYKNADGGEISVADASTLGNLKVRIMYGGNEVATHTANGSSAVLNGYLTAALRLNLNTSFYDNYELYYDGNALTTGKTSLELTISALNSELVVKQKPSSRISIGYFNASGLATVPANTYGLSFTVGSSVTQYEVPAAGMTCDYTTGTTLTFAVTDAVAFNAYVPYVNGAKVTTTGTTFAVTITNAVTNIEMRSMSGESPSVVQIRMNTYDAEGLEEDYSLENYAKIGIIMQRNESVYRESIEQSNFVFAALAADTITIQIPDGFYTKYLLTADGTDVEQDEQGGGNTIYSTVLSSSAVFNIDVYKAPDVTGSTSHVYWGFYSESQDGYEATSIITVPTIDDPLYGLKLSVGNDASSVKYSVRNYSTLTAKVGDRLYFTADSKDYFNYYSIHIEDGGSVQNYNSLNGSASFYYIIKSGETQIYFVSVNGGANATVSWSTLSGRTGGLYTLNDGEKTLMDMVSFTVDGINVNIGNGKGNFVAAINSKIDFECTDIRWFDFFTLNMDGTDVDYDSMTYSAFLTASSYSITFTRKTDINITFSFADYEGNVIDGLPSVEYRKKVDLNGNETEQYLIIDGHYVISKDPLQYMTLTHSRSGNVLLEKEIRDMYESFTKTYELKQVRMGDNLRFSASVEPDYDVYIDGILLTVGEYKGVYDYSVPMGKDSISVVFRQKMPAGADKVTVQWSFYDSYGTQSLKRQEIGDLYVILYDFDKNEVARYNVDEVGRFETSANCYIGFSSLTFTEKYSLYAYVNGVRGRVLLLRNNGGGLAMTSLFPLNVVGSTVQFLFTEYPDAMVGGSNGAMLDISLYSTSSAAFNPFLEVSTESDEYTKIIKKLRTYYMSEDPEKVYNVKLIIAGDENYGSNNIDDRKNLVDYLSAYPEGYGFTAMSNITLEGDTDKRISNITASSVFKVYVNGVEQYPSNGGFTFTNDTQSKVAVVDIVYLGG